MKNLHYHCKELFNGQGNFGDNVTPYIAGKLGYDWQYTPADDKPHYFLTGSILKFANSSTTVLGAGFGSATQNVTGTPTLKIVRGKLTGDILAKTFEPTWVLGDPALALPQLFSPKVEKTTKLGVIPHYADLDLVTDPIIAPTLPVENFITKVLQCEAVISSSLHGLIVAQAYGIPWAWVKYSDRVNSPNDFKFHDFFSSVGVKAKFTDLRVKQNFEPVKQGFRPNGLLTIIKRGLK